MHLNLIDGVSESVTLLHDLLFHLIWSYIYLLTVVFCFSKQGPNFDLSAAEGRSVRVLFIYLGFCCVRGGGSCCRAEKVEWGHQVGNLWPSFLMSSMRVLSRTKPREARVRGAVHTRPHEKLWALHVKSRSTASLAFGQYLRTKLADVKRLWRQGFRGGEGGANTDVLWLLCGFECSELCTANK